LIGIILPALAESLRVAPETFTVVFVMQQLGLLIGNFLVGTVADRIGRRVTLLVCLTAFGALTLVTMYATTIPELVVLRFIAGVFFSGVIPNCVSLVSEIIPKRLRASAVSVTFSGYTGGILLGSVVQGYLVPYGWQAAFVVGGVLPLLLVGLLYFTLPESPRYLANRKPRDPGIARLLRRLDPTLVLDGDEQFVVREEQVIAQKIPVLALFQQGRWAATLLLWAGFHMAFVVSNLFGAWKTTVLHDFGDLPFTRIAVLMGVQSIAGIVGTITGGFVMDRYEPTRVLPVYLAAASLATAAVAFTDLNSGWTLVAFLAFGYFSNAGLGGINALAAISYPSSIRSTGVSWAHGAGRAGAMVGPALGGAMIARDLGVPGVFLITAIPQMLAAVAIFALWRVGKRGGDRPLPAPAPPATAT
jgi:AAHS family 4-hydroxybenzoate transporter-like MFS transporter